MKKKIDFIDASTASAVDWIRVHARGMKTHYVHKTLLAPLMVDLETRGANVVEQAPANSARFEFRSLVYFMDRPEEQVKIDMLRVVIPSKDVSLTIEILNGLDERTFKTGEKYFKLKCESCCIVFSPDQKDMFTAGLMTLEDQANERDKVFVENAIIETDEDS